MPVTDILEGLRRKIEVEWRWSTSSRTGFDHDAGPSTPRIPPAGDVVFEDLHPGAVRQRQH